MMKTISPLVVALAVAATGCGDAEVANSAMQQPQTSESAVRAEVSVQTARTGRDIYLTSCAECHGKSGEGAEKGISLIKGHALYHTSDDFIRRVTNGKADEMPAFKDKLTAAEIAEVVRYVREGIQGPFVKKGSESGK